MSRFTRAVLAVIVAWPAIAAEPEAAAEPEKPVKVAVFDFSGQIGITEDQLESLIDLVANAIRQFGPEYEVFAKSDLRSLLDFEQTRQMLGCDDAGCLAELGGALGVDFVVSGNVAHFEGTYLFNMRRVDPKRATVVAGVSKKIEGGEARLLDEVPLAVAELFGFEDAASLFGEAAPPVTFLDWSPWVAGGLAVAAGAVGGAMAGLAWNDQGSMDDEYRGTPGWQDLKDGAEQKALIGDIMFGVAGACAVTAVVLTVLSVTREDEPEEKPEVGASLIPLRDGGAAAVSVSW